MAVMGKPRKFKTAEELEKQANSYFDKCDKEGKPYLVTELALHLGFTSRQDLINQEGYGDDYYDVIKRAKSRVESSYERLLYEKGTAGSIFALKNMGWSDRIDLNGQMNHTLSVDGIMQTLNQSGLPTLDGDDLSTNTDIEDGETTTPNVT